MTVCTYLPTCIEASEVKRLALRSAKSLALTAWRNWKCAWIHCAIKQHALQIAVRNTSWTLGIKISELMSMAKYIHC